MRVVCLVPSLTETLIEAGIEVVGRTRFCIHPQVQVQNIPAIGGTKDLNFEKFAALKPDLLILDKEENLPWMKEQANCQTLVSHITSIADMCGFSQELWQIFPENKVLADFVRRWRIVDALPNAIWNWQAIPGATEVWGISRVPKKNLRYMIWKDPWMSVGQGTFISSVLTKLGAGNFLHSTSDKYPKHHHADLRNSDCVYLFSSEPYPFPKLRFELQQLTQQGALVNGESYSWFGIRSLRFLEANLQLTRP